MPPTYECREVTIDYTYDGLNRLTKAEYSTGEVFEYTYDAAGNRLTQTVTLEETPVTTSYTYDEANRLTQVGEQAYTWDANGNLLSDGERQYTYDPANRLTSLTEGEATSAYYYNGLGDRIAQVEDGEQTSYILDLNAGLTQVLNDGAHAYVYGLDLVSQSDGIYEEYPLRDALGSVRQVTDQSSAITGYQSYEPYGSVLSSSGQADMSYGYAGEWTDNSGMQYLRARYYEPSVGRFVGKDSWGGNAEFPASYNKWSYAYGNPVLFIDPSGHYNREAAVSFAMAHDLNDKFPDEGYYDFPGPYYQSQCAMFVSSALSVGGYPTVDSIWPGYEGTKLDPEKPDDEEHFFSNRPTLFYEGAWIRSNELYNYLRPNNQELVPSNNNPVNFRSSDWVEWFSIVGTTIKMGDVVFYQSEDDYKKGLAWGHVAMIVGWGSKTHYQEDPIEEIHSYYKCYEGAKNDLENGGMNSLRPLVVERSGLIQYQEHRSIDNTSSKIHSISIIHIVQ